MKEILCAPLQGFTDRAWREAHADLYRELRVEPPRYCAPFARVEKGIVRPRDIREVKGDANVLPQAIFKDLRELDLIAEAMSSVGHTHLDLNLGCPFPPQVKAGRGAALILNPTMLSEVARWMEERTDMTFSIKMRPGVREADEWKGVVDIINSMPLANVTIHPRIAVQGYKGDVDMDTFAEMLTAIAHPVIFNGNILTPSDASMIADRFPTISGLMIGRGMLMRPTLAAEIARGEEQSPESRADAWIELLRRVGEKISESSAGDAQALARLRPRLEYADEELLGHKYIKSLKKASNLDKFLNILG
ncbi:MAG: tRNA-dihydrouridine synthase family protein [Duncaniella sp.]|nr:tRNA-dihydrouridine synthase family protein [Duncaniella sp.]